MQRIGKTDYWPLWQCLLDREPCEQNNWKSIPREILLVALANCQWDNHGTRLDIITGRDLYQPDLEPAEEIDKIMRSKPRGAGGRG